MSHRILVIDHHPQGLERFVDPLRSAGYDVTVARTAADGASCFGRIEPHLVFIAARLPRTHGTVLCRELKRTASGSRIPIVLVVESTGIQMDLPPLDQFGADRLVQKPFSADELLGVCRELLASGAAPASSIEHDRRAADNDDGLSTALEELDVLEFDLPANVTRGSDGATLPASPTVPIDDDRGADIESHIDDLFGADPNPAPASFSAPEPSTGGDNDADAIVLEDFDLETEVDSRLSGTPEAGPVRQQPILEEPAPRPVAPPSIPSATATVFRPTPGGGQTAGRFQIEAMTRKSAATQPQSVVASGPTAVPRRWLWVAIPLTAAIVALAVFFMSRPQTSETASAAAPPTGFGNETLAPVATADGRPAFDFKDIDVRPSRVAAVTEPDELEPVDEPAESPIAPKPEKTAEPPVVEKRQVASVPKPPRKPTPSVPVPTPEPEPRPEPEVVAEIATLAQETVEPEPVAKPVVIEEPAVVAAEPQPEPEPEPEVPTQPDVELEPEWVPEPAPIVEPVTEPEPVLPEPITRDPILIQRVEPRISERDLKKVTGTVVLRVRVGKTGAVSRVLVEEGIPGSPLEGAAVAAVLRWRYKPALDRDEPIEAWATARFTFGE